MSCPYRGFNIYHPEPVPHPHTIADAAVVAAKTNANIVRVTVSWQQIQPTETTWNLAPLDEIKNYIDAARAHNPAMTVLPTIVDTPTWVSGRSTNGHYVTTSAGYSSYGQACRQILVHLGDRADCIELSNEHNALPIPSNPHGTSIPAEHYGPMAAYAAFWLYYCFGDTKFPVVGSLMPAGSASSMNGGWIPYMQAVQNHMHSTFDQLYPASTFPSENAALRALWRLSLHPYPARGTVYTVPGRTYYPTDPDNAEGDQNAGEATTTVLNQIDLIRTNFAGRKLWITETGVSERKIGETDQMYFAYLLVEGIGDRPQVEGLTFWPLCDSDPMQSDVQGQFCRMAVMKYDLNQPKAAGALIKLLFGIPTW